MDVEGGLYHLLSLVGTLALTKKFYSYGKYKQKKINYPIIDMHYKDKKVLNQLSLAINKIIDKNTVIVCIGTNKIVGDSLGPVVGTLLKRNNFSHPVYGTLENPIHALNLEESLKNITSKHPYSNLLAIDAAVGCARNIGNIRVRRGSIYPGKGAGKKLPSVGNCSIVGIVEEFDKTHLQNVSLDFVMELAELISSSIVLSYK